MVAKPPDFWVVLGVLSAIGGLAVMLALPEARWLGWLLIAVVIALAVIYAIRWVQWNRAQVKSADPGDRTSLTEGATVWKTGQAKLPIVTFGLQGRSDRCVSTACRPERIRFIGPDQTVRESDLPTVVRVGPARLRVKAFLDDGFLVDELGHADRVDAEVYCAAQSSSAAISSGVQT